MRIIANVRVGKPEVSPSAPSHVPGVREGNEGRGGNMQGIGTPRRSTGISPSRHAPIDPRMPVLTPP